MQSKTSSCEIGKERTGRFPLFQATVFRKNMTRYAPVWALACIFFYCAYYMMFNFGRMDGRDLFDAMPFFTIVNLLYAPLTVWALFGYLFRTREAYALHAMPLTRTGRYVTHLCNAALFGALPYFVFILFGLTNFAPGELAYLWQWAVVIAGQYLCFLGLAVFSAFCSGNGMGFLTLYGLLNFGPLLLEQWLRMTYLPLLYGVEIKESFLSDLCVANLYMEKRIATYSYLPADGGSASAVFVPAIEWGLVALLAVIGLALLVLSCRMYRRRRLETAGDLLAVRGLAPVFLLAYTMAVATMFAFFGSIFGVSPIPIFGGSYGTSSGMNLFALIGMVVGFFTGHMLLARKVHVFTKRTMLGFAALMGALLLSIGLVKVGGEIIVSRVPQAEQVSHVRLEAGGEQRTLSDRADIETLLQIHRACLAERDLGSDSMYGIQIYIEYTLRDGETLSRRYQVERFGSSALQEERESTRLLLELLRLPSLPAGFPDEESFVDLAGWVDVMEVYWTHDNIWRSDFSREEIRTFLAAIWRDYEEGHLYSDFYIRHRGMESVVGIELYLSKVPVYESRYGDMSERRSSWRFSITEDAVHTLAVWRDLTSEAEN